MARRGRAREQQKTKARGAARVEVQGLYLSPLSYLGEPVPKVGLHFGGVPPGVTGHPHSSSSVSPEALPPLPSWLRL